MKDAARERLLITKRKAIDILGGKCACCGMDELLYLTIDHIKPIRRRSRARGRMSAGMYRDVIRGKTENLACLCMPCNTSKGLGERCTIDHDLWGPRLKK